MRGRRIVAAIAIAGVLVCACGSADDATVPAAGTGHGSGADTGPVTCPWIRWCSPSRPAQAGSLRCRSRAAA